MSEPAADEPQPGGPAGDDVAERLDRLEEDKLRDVLPAEEERVDAERVGLDEEGGTG